ncbi:MAG: ATP-dependent sacrificial sulfur transferase LarE [Eubacterium sp.]|nr:ATP-dependent sacrificial sulfur transferase LarE [Eubacterium sp.]
MKKEEFFSQHKEVAVAFSGGVDSALVLSLAKEYAKRAKAYFVKSQFQPSFELDDALKTAKKIGAEIEIIEYDILADKAVVQNPENRCYYCKKRIMGAIVKSAENDGFTTVIDGTNASDNSDDRPGEKALAEFKILSPLRLCNIDKAQVRQLARERKIVVADKPSYACLATRIPSGTAITADALKTTEQAENELFSLGFSDFRVRNFGSFALLQLSAEDFAKFSKLRAQTFDILKKYYDNAFLDLKERRGYD